MPQQDDFSLCCCEYISEDGERSHLLAAFCNCEAIDEAFERMLTLKPLKKEIVEKIINTVSDRLRIPWYGGAKKIPLDVASAVLIVLFIILLGCFSWTFIIITYMVILPLVLVSVHFISKKVVHEHTSTYNLGRSRDVKKIPRTKFYISWLTASVAFLLAIYYTQVIAYLKISSYENLVFMSFTCISCTSLYLVRATSCAGFDSPSRKGDKMYEEVIESGAWRICGNCEKQVPRQASHCRTCDTCYLLRDHHCVWLDTCVSNVNDRWFVIGLSFALPSLCYGAHLSLTTVCHPYLLDLYFTTILFPHQCPDAFMDVQSSLSISGACYSILMGTFVAVTLIQQLICVIAGVRLREYRLRRRLPGQAGFWSFRYVFINCIKFWWRE